MAYGDVLMGAFDGTLSGVMIFDGDDTTIRWVDYYCSATGVM